VKTLHPGVHGGILARRDLPDHMAAIAAHDISTIDIVVVNLYPFRQTVTAANKPSYEVRPAGHVTKRRWCAKERCLVGRGGCRIVVFSLSWWCFAPSRGSRSNYQRLPLPLLALPPPLPCPAPRRWLLRTLTSAAPP
jgi:hypothetical protein